MRMQISPARTVDFEGGDEDDDDGSVDVLAREIALSEDAPVFVRRVVQADAPVQGDDVEVLRAQIVEEYRESVFSDKPTGPPPVRGPFGEATIILKPGAVPVKQRMFQIQGERRKAWNEGIEKLEREQKLEDGVSAWSSPSFPVPKKVPGTYRIVVDYRALNEATVADAHPLPRIEDILQAQGKHSMWSVLDMRDGYHQVPLRKEDRHLTCMSTPRGTKQWSVLVMGLKNGGAIFQRMMEWVLRDLSGPG